MRIVELVVVLFTPVGVQHISDGTIGGLDIRYFVDKNTGVLCALTEKYRWGIFRESVDTVTIKIRRK